MSSDHHIGVVVNRVVGDFRYVFSQLKPGALHRVGPLLSDFYYDLDALSAALLISLVVATLCHTTSVLTRNQSVVRRRRVVQRVHAPPFLPLQAHLCPRRVC